MTGRALFVSLFFSLTSCHTPVDSAVSQMIDDVGYSADEEKVISDMGRSLGDIDQDLQQIEANLAEWNEEKTHI